MAIRDGAIDRIIRRLEALEEGYRALAASYGWRALGLHLNLDLLFHAVDAYFQDVDRIKDYRHIQHLDRHKQAAFTMKWLTMHRPVQIDPEHKGHSDLPLEESGLLANEIFAIHSGLAYMSIPISELVPVYYRNLLYTLHFHPVLPEQLASEMFLLERLYG
jgi:hypothetical protein